MCILLGGSAIFEILDLNMEERRRFINEIFIKPMEPSFLYPYFVGLAEFLTYAMPIVSRSYFSMINLYSIGPTVVKSVDVETIRHRRNSMPYRFRNEYLTLLIGILSKLMILLFPGLEEIENLQLIMLLFIAKWKSYFFLLRLLIFIQSQIINLS